MSIEKIALNKLLCLFYAPNNLRIRMLRDDIRRSRPKLEDENSEGGDFHTSFWSDAKKHAINQADLYECTAVRVAAHPGRRRLYPELRDGFLTWFNERRRWHNEPLNPLAPPAKAQLPMDGLGVVKVESILGVQSEPGFQRLVYPYFAEKPALPDEGGRLGLWAMAEALKNHDPADMRVLDILRSRTFAIADNPLVGDEQEIFHHRYRVILNEWNKLKEEY